MGFVSPISDDRLADPRDFGDVPGVRKFGKWSRSKIDSHSTPNTPS